MANEAPIKIEMELLEKFWAIPQLGSVVFNKTKGIQ